MSGDDVGGYGGPSDDGVGVAAWRLSQRLDGARAEFTETAAAKRRGPVLAALLARLNAADKVER